MRFWNSLQQVPSKPNKLNSLRIFGRKKTKGPQSAKATYAWERSTLTLIIITWISIIIYLINHVSAEALITGGWYTQGRIVHQQICRLSDSNKNVDIQFSAHNVSGITFIKNTQFIITKYQRQFIIRSWWDRIHNHVNDTNHDILTAK
jgi:hypothetical protein